MKIFAELLYSLYDTFFKSYNEIDLVISNILDMFKF
jgi:hypothetical protein